MQQARSLAITFILFVSSIASGAQPCAALAKFSMPDHRVVIRQAQEVAASLPGVSLAVPAHCRVEGVIDERTGATASPTQSGSPWRCPPTGTAASCSRAAAD